MTPRTRARAGALAPPAPRQPAGLGALDLYPVVYLAAHDEVLYGEAGQVRRRGLVQAAATACGRNPVGFDLRLVQQTAPHHAFRRGFPEFRLALAHSPSLVLAPASVDVSPFDRIGIPASHWHPGQPIDEDALALSREPDWKRPVVTGELATRVASADAVAICDPGVPPMDAEGTLSISLSPFGRDDVRPADYVVVEGAALDVPLASVEAEGTVIAPRPEDHRLIGVLSFPMYLRREKPASPRLVQYTTCLRPVPNIDAPSLLYGVYPVFPGKLGPMQSVMSALVCGLRGAGFRGPVTYCARPGRGPIQPQAAMEPVSLQQEFGPFEFMVSDEVPVPVPVEVRFSFRDLDLRFGVNALLDWLVRHRGQTDECRSMTHVCGPRWFTDYVAAHGFNVDAPPAEAASYEVRPAPLQPE